MPELVRSRVSEINLCARTVTLIIHSFHEEMDSEKA